MKRKQLVLVLMIVYLSVGLGCANYGAFQGFTSDFLYISPSPIQRRLVAPQFFSPTHTSTTLHADYFIYLTQDSYFP